MQSERPRQLKEQTGVTSGSREGAGTADDVPVHLADFRQRRTDVVLPKPERRNMIGLKHRTVLIVEDDRGVAMLERRKLERAGYSAVTANSANEAINQLAGQTVDLVLLDYRLPNDVDGLDLYEEMKTLGFDVPVILVTGFSNEAIVIRALRNGVRDFVSKSIEYLDYLPEAVERVLKQVDVERQLVESEERFRTLADAAPVFIWVSDESAERTFCNRRWLEFRGRDLESEIGFGWTDGIHYDDKANVLSVLRDACQRRKPYTVEYRVRRADGNFCWILDSGAPRFLPNGTFRGLIGSAIEISERKKVEEALRLLGAAVEQSNDAVFITTFETDPACAQIVFINSAFTKLTGYRNEEISNVTLHVLNGEKTDRGTLRRLRRSLISGKPFTGETINYRRDGSEFCVEWNVSPLRNGKDEITHFVFTLRDITERKQSEDALLESERRFRTFMDNSPAIAVIKDEEGKYIYVSSTWERYLGGKASDKIGKTDLEIWPEQTAVEIREHDRIALTKNKLFEVEENVPTANGQIAHLLTFKFPFSDRFGKRLLGGVSIDITEHKRVEEQFRHAQKMDAIGQLAGGIAHDFNNLLTGILGYSDLLLDKGMETSIADDVHEIRKLGERAAALTGQLLAFSRRQPLQPVTVNLTFLVERTAKILRRMIGEHIELKLIADERVGNVKVDCGQMEQVLMNLAVNARDAMPDGGKLTIEVCDEYVGQAYSEQNSAQIEPGPYVLLSISDTGMGMDQGTRERIFEPFFTTKPRGKGTGLGLSLVYGIVKQHGGHVDVHSEPGKGTCFKLFFPKINEEPDASPAKKEKSVATGDESVLLVDDEATVRDITARILRMNGYRVTSASSAEDALRIVTETREKFDLLVTDLIMPGMNGVELYTKLTELRPRTPVLFISGFADSKLLQQCQMESSNACLLKPFDSAALAKKVRSAIDTANTSRKKVDL